MMSAAFSPIMMVGALRLPVVIEGMIEASTTRSASTPITRVCGSTTASGSLARAHLARAAGMIGALDLVADEGVDRLVVDAIGARLDFAAAVGIEGGLRENLAGQPHAGAHFRPVVWLAHVIELDARRLGADLPSASRTQPRLFDRIGPTWA